MGYTTDFTGRFTVTPRLDDETYDYLVKFAETRRMKRRLPKKFGVDGEFYVDGGGPFGQDHEPSVIDSNSPPSTQPGLWCQWTPSEDHEGIEWDQGEKFYEYVKWLRYLIKNFLAPKDYKVNGTVEYQGESADDFGRIVVKDNVVEDVPGRQTFADEDMSDLVISEDQIKAMFASLVAGKTPVKGTLLDWLHRIVTNDKVLADLRGLLQKKTGVKVAKKTKKVKTPPVAKKRKKK